MCIVVVVLCVLLSSYVYLLYYVCVAVFTLDAGLLAISQYRKVLRPATSTQVFLGFPLYISKCCDGSQDSRLPLHASHVALPKFFSPVLAANFVTSNMCVGHVLHFRSKSVKVTVRLSAFLSDLKFSVRNLVPKCVPAVILLAVG